MPTIDQIMAWSPSFYRDLGGIKERVMVMGSRGGLSCNWSNPAARAGTIQEVRARVQLPGAVQPDLRPAGRRRAAAAARRSSIGCSRTTGCLRNSNRRLSAADRQRLDDHLARLAELQRRLGAGSAGTQSCAAVRRPTEDSGRAPDPKRRLQLMSDVVAAAFMCGTSRLAVLGAYDQFISTSEEWHGVAHNWFNPGQQKLLVDSYRAFFQSIFLDLAHKLDVEEVPGVTYLDNTLIAWTQESGMQTHDSVTIPVITAGSAAGFLATGMYCDYRNTKMSFVWAGRDGRAPMYHGLTWNCWLGTVLQAMGIPRAEYERPGVPGYGQPLIGPDYRGKYASGVVESASEVLPFLTA